MCDLPYFSIISSLSKLFFFCGGGHFEMLTADDVVDKGCSVRQASSIVRACCGKDEAHFSLCAGDKSEEE